MLVHKVNNVERKTFEKQPWESFNISIDFSDELGSGNTILSYSINAFDGDGNVDTSILADVSEAHEVIAVGIKGGTDGTVYTVQSKVTSTATCPNGDNRRHMSTLGLKVTEKGWY